MLCLVKGLHRPSAYLLLDFADFTLAKMTTPTPVTGVMMRRITGKGAMMGRVMALKTIPFMNKRRQSSGRALQYLWCPFPLHVAPSGRFIYNRSTGGQRLPRIRGWLLASRCTTPAPCWPFLPGKSLENSTPSTTTDIPTSGGARRIGVDAARGPLLKAPPDVLP